jgi:hypothetical protein
MTERGMELGLLFSGRTSFYEQFGWTTWKAQRAIAVRATGRAPRSSEAKVELDTAVVCRAFDAESDFADLKALQDRYARSRSGSVIRDESLWRASFALAGNPAEEFAVARRDGRLVAYVRVARLYGLLNVTDLARTDDGAAALASLLAAELREREDDPLAGPGIDAASLRAKLLLPAFDDLQLTLALEECGITSKPFEDPSGMVRCFDAEALSKRLDAPLLENETAGEFVERVLPPDGLVFWPADRF